MVKSPIDHDSKSLPRLAVIIPTYNRWAVARLALLSLKDSSYRDFEIVLIEDGCQDGTVDNCRKEFPDIHIIHGDGNLWWSGAINRGIEYALKRGVELVLWLNDDNRVEPETLPRLIETYDGLEGLRVICGRVKSIDTGKDEWIGGPPFWRPNYNSWTPPAMAPALISLDHPPGGRGVLIPTQCFRDVGLIDQRAFPQYWADHDFHYRAFGLGYKYHLRSDAVIWNLPYVEPPDAPARFSLKWIIQFLFGRRSSMNVIALRRFLKRHLRPAEYHAIYYSWLRNILNWMITGWIIKKPFLHRSVRYIKRILTV